MRTSHYRGIAGIDYLKVVAIFAVICIHVKPFSYSANLYSSDTLANLSTTIVILCQFAVPCFFIMSGYLFAKSAETTGLISTFHRRQIRLLRLFLVWNVFYGLFPLHIKARSATYGWWAILPMAFVENTLAFAKTHPLIFFLRGTSEHLWYLPALILALTFIYICITSCTYITTLIIAIIIYICGFFVTLLLKTPFTQLLSAPLFVALGVFLYNKHIEIDIFYGKLLVLFGLVFLPIEHMFIIKYFGFTHFGYSFAVIPFSYGIFIIMLRSSFQLILFSLAQLVLGIYLIHVFIFQTTIVFVAHFNPIAFDIIIPFFVFAVSAFITFILSKLPITRQLVN